MYRQLAGDPAGALRVLEKADEATRTLDSPLLSYETARVRARALLALGYPTEARRQATLALMIAKEGGWEHRSRWITAEFGVSGLYHHVRATASVAMTAAQERDRRRLDALQQVGLVAAKVLDPEQLARVALDATIRVFGAERAFLFLLDEDGGHLVPRVGRDGTGRDLDALTGYSATLVNRVRDGGDALVVTGDEDGRSVASESAVVHGLRSIMVAPLRLADRLLGVVYLDSRVAKGIFTVEDVDVLVAITNHVAVSLETARAAQLEVAVHAARQQRDLAETLRSAMSRISSTLDPDEVLDRLLDTAARTLSADAACLVRHHDGLHTVVGRHGRAATDAVGRRVDPGADPALAAVIEASVATRGTILAGEPAPLGDLLPGTRSWIAVPLATGTKVVGFLVAASGVPERYTDADVDIIATLAGQGMAAYDKARLFEQVRELATVDGLTGVYNRRYALELAERQFAEAGAFAPVAAIMVDIDHFKSVNDTHGHLAGDQVIREVAARLRGAVRAEDVLGRYGGEEFVLVVAAPRAVADELAARVHRAVNGSPIDTGAGQLSTTVSVGVAYRRPADRDLGALLSRADRALYIAKEQGRNRVAAA